MGLRECRSGLVSDKLKLMICMCFFFLMIRRPPRSTQSRSSAASDVYKRQVVDSVRALEAFTSPARAEPHKRQAEQTDALLAKNCLLYTSPSPRDS